MKPATMALVLVVVFSLVFTGNAHYRLDLLVGLFLWDFFAEGTKVGLLSLLAKSYVLTKTTFPRWILVATSASSPVVTLAVFVGVLLLALAYSGRRPGLVALSLFAWYLVQLALIVLGFSLGASVLFLRYRDLNQVWEVLVHAGFFVAPIVYPLDVLPERFHFFLYLWPPTPVIQFSRMVLVQGVIPSAHAHLLLAAMTASVLGTGVLIFRRLEPGAAEHV
jgi:lipopolysaccharide transport system permease protein